MASPKQTLGRSTSSASMFGRKSDFSNVNTTMQSFRKMKMHTRFDEPGPGDYQVAGLPIPKGGRFNMSKPKSKVEWEIYRAKQLPGPADYGVPALPKPGGGRFSTAKPKTQLDWVTYFAKQLPGAADYGAPKLPKPGGGRFSEANPKSEIEWLQYFAAQLPGPSDYNPRVDKLSTQKTVPAYPIYGKVVMGNHQTTLSNAIMYMHTTVNQQGPNQCRNDSAMGKQVDSTKKSKPSFSFGKSGAQPSVLNRRDVQRQLGGRLVRNQSDKYAKFFGYSPSNRRQQRMRPSKSARGFSMRIDPLALQKAQRPVSVQARRRPRRRKARRKSPARRRRRRAPRQESDEEIWDAEDDEEYGSGAARSPGAGAGAGDGGTGGKEGEYDDNDGETGEGGGKGGEYDEEEEDDGNVPSPVHLPRASSKSPTRRRRKTRRKKRTKRRTKRGRRRGGGATSTAQPQGMYAMLEAVRQGGRPVFSGDRSIPGVGSYDPSPSTMGFVFDSTIPSNPSFSFSNVD